MLKVSTYMLMHEISSKAGKATIEDLITNLEDVYELLKGKSGASSCNSSAIKLDRSQSHGGSFMASFISDEDKTIRERANVIQEFTISYLRIEIAKLCFKANDEDYNKKGVKKVDQALRPLKQMGVEEKERFNDVFLHLCKEITNLKNLPGYKQ